MTNIASDLKVEITRVARKEMRTDLDALKKTSNEQRKAFAALRREVKELAARLKHLGKTATRVAHEEEAGDADPIATRRRFSASRFAAHRARLELSVADYGRLVGVSGQSIFKWEQGSVRPRAAQIEAPAAIRPRSKKDALARLSGGRP